MTTANNMFLIVGLGNPGTRYEGTRHNIGFRCTHALADKYGLKGKSETRFKSLVSIGEIEGRKGIIAQPVTYMNLSGEAVLALTQFYKIPLESVLVVVDDTALPFGKVRFRQQGSAGSHNGLKSIIQCLGSQAFPRLRVGVGDPPPGWDLADYVLARFTPEEQAALEKIVPITVETLTYWVTHDTEQAMNRYNSMELISPPPVTEA